MRVSYEHAVTDRLAARSPHLWALTIAFFGIGDVLTTLVGLPLARVVEAGPVAGPLMSLYGTTEVMLLLKTGTVGVCYLFWRVTPAPYNIGIPLGLASLGVLVTTWNLAVIAAAIS